MAPKVHVDNEICHLNNIDQDNSTKSFTWDDNNYENSLEKSKYFIHLYFFKFCIRKASFHTGKLLLILCILWSFG